MNWIKVEDSLPQKDVWVQVYEDDEDNPQDAYIGKMCGSFRQRVTPAKLHSVDEEGYADWYLCYVGGGPMRITRNVTHWKHLSEGPTNEKEI